MLKKALGKGLSALLPPITFNNEELMELDIDRLDTNEEQPRSYFDEQRLQELADSIRENGLVQPILVRRKGERYQIIAGERRWRAAQLAGWVKISAVVKEVPDDKLLELALVENIARQELNPIEEAQAYQKLIGNYNLTQEQVAQKVGKERSSVTNILRLLKLPEEIQQLVAADKLSMGHARALLSLDDLAFQQQLVERIMTEFLSVREVERLVEQRKQPVKEKEIPVEDPKVKAAETSLGGFLGTQVKIAFGKKGGRIQINFQSEDELNRLYTLLVGKQPDNSA